MKRLNFIVIAIILSGLFLVSPAGSAFSSPSIPTGTDAVAAQGPKVIEVQPRRNAVGVSPSISIQARFDQPVTAGSLTAGTFVAFGSQTGKRAGTITYNPWTQTAALNPATPFRPGESVQAIVASGIQSPGGSPAIPAVWQFITRPLNGSGIFNNRTAVSAGGQQPLGAALADFNKDGSLDLAVANEISGTVSLFRNDGAGNFSPNGSFICRQPSLQCCRSGFERRWIP